MCVSIANLYSPRSVTITT